MLLLVLLVVAQLLRELAELLERGRQPHLAGLLEVAIAKALAYLQAAARGSRRGRQRMRGAMWHADASRQAGATARAGVRWHAYANAA